MVDEKKVFKREDYLTADKFAKKYNVGRNKVLAEMRKLHNVKVPGERTAVCVVRNVYAHDTLSRLMIHPLAESYILERVKNKSKGE